MDGCDEIAARRNINSELATELTKILHPEEIPTYGNILVVSRTWVLMNPLQYHRIFCFCHIYIEGQVHCVFIF